MHKSSMEACEACTEAIWLRKLIFDLFDQISESTIIYCDNQSCIRLSEHLVFHERSKHIEIKYYFIRDKVQEGEVKLKYIPTDEQTSNILTKPLSRIKFAYFWEKMGIVEITPLVEREEMNLQVGRDHWHIIEDIHFQDWKIVHLGQIFSCSESVLRFLMDRHFPVRKMVQIVDVP